MAIRINDIAPDFTAESTAGTIRFHDWLGDSYGIIFSHPRDFTPVCTTEFAAVAQLAAEWKKRNTKVIGVSVDSVADHEKWKRDIEAFGGARQGERDADHHHKHHDQQWHEEGGGARHAFLYAQCEYQQGKQPYAEQGAQYFADKVKADVCALGHVQIFFKEEGLRIAAPCAG